MFFDIHTHAFHPKIAHKAVDHLNTVYHLDCRGDGTIEHLLEREKAAGIDRCIVLCAATAPAQVIPANNYAMKLQREHEEVIGFGTLHPAYVDWEDELERMKAGGLRGIKLHPDFQGFALNDRRLLPIFESTYGYTVEVQSAGTGKAISAAKFGNADLILVHAKSQEEAVVEEGFARTVDGFEAERISFLYNYFVLCGPSADPAGVKEAASVLDAFAAIAEGEYPFISRGDGF